MSSYRPSDYWEDLLGRQYDLAGVAYPDFPVAFNQAMYAQLLRAVRSAMRAEQVSVRGTDVLEVGPGTGFWVQEWLAEGAASVTGLDLTETAARALATRFPDQAFSAGDISTADLRLGEFDVVVAMSVLLHIVDDDRFATALANIAAMLRPSGSVVLIEPLVRHRWWGPPVGPESNSRARTLTQWHAALATAGLELVAERPTTALLANVCDTRRPLTWRLHMAYWWVLRGWLTRVPRLQGVTTRLLVLADRALVRLGAAPSAKVMVVRPARAYSPTPSEP